MDQDNATEDYYRFCSSLDKLDEHRKDSLLYTLISHGCHGLECDSSFIQKELDSLLVSQARSDAYKKLVRRVGYYTSRIRKHRTEKLTEKRLMRLKQYRHGMQLISNQQNHDLHKLIAVFDRLNMDELVRDHG